MAHFVFDTARGDDYRGPRDDAIDLNYADGGSVNGLASPALSASVTINGHSGGIPVDYNGEIISCNCGDRGNRQGAGVWYSAYDEIHSTSNYDDNIIYNYSGVLPVSITNSSSRTPQSVGGGQGRGEVPRAPNSRDIELL